MRILYIASGYGKIYRYFDKAILNAFKSLQIPILYCSNNASFDVLKKKCNTFQPTILFTLVGDKLPNEWLVYFEQNQIKRAVWLTEDPYYTDRNLAILDNYHYLFTINRASVLYYKSLGYENVFHLPLGTDPNIFFPKKKRSVYQSDLCFVGAPYPSRIELIQRLVKDTSYHLLLIGKWKEHIHIPKAKKVTVINKWLPPEKIADYYSNAKIVLNTHRPAFAHFNENSVNVKNESINNRTFDILASKAFTIMEQIPDLQSYFEIGTEIIAYETEKELLSYIRMYLEQETARSRIAEKGRNKVLSKHTFTHRIRHFLQHLS